MSSKAERSNTEAVESQDENLPVKYTDPKKAIETLAPEVIEIIVNHKELPQLPLIIYFEKNKKNPAELITWVGVPKRKPPYRIANLKLENGQEPPCYYGYAFLPKEYDPRTSITTLTEKEYIDYLNEYNKALITNVKQRLQHCGIPLYEVPAAKDDPKIPFSSLEIQPRKNSQPISKIYHSDLIPEDLKWSHTRLYLKSSTYETPHLVKKAEEISNYFQNTQNSAEMKYFAEFIKSKYITETDILANTILKICDTQNPDTIKEIFQQEKVYLLILACVRYSQKAGERFRPPPTNSNEALSLILYDHIVSSKDYILKEMEGLHSVDLKRLLRNYEMYAEEVADNYSSVVKLPESLSWRNPISDFKPFIPDLKKVARIIQNELLRHAVQSTTTDLGYNRV